MGFWQRAKNGLARFMYGRNGADQLSLTLIWVLIALNLAGLLVRSGAVGLALNALGTAVAVWTIFRVFSRNLPRRRAENAAFMKRVWYPAGNRLRRLRDREHKYFTCPTCRTVCRVPRGKGSIVITCPKCRAQIRGRS